MDQQFPSRDQCQAQIFRTLIDSWKSSGSFWIIEGKNRGMPSRTTEKGRARTKTILSETETTAHVQSLRKSQQKLQYTKKGQNYKFQPIQLRIFLRFRRIFLIDMHSFTINTYRYQTDNYSSLILYVLLFSSTSSLNFLLILNNITPIKTTPPSDIKNGIIWEPTLTSLCSHVSKFKNYYLVQMFSFPPKYQKSYWRFAHTIIDTLSCTLH